MKKIQTKSKEKEGNKIKKSFQVILGFSVPSIIFTGLLGNTCFLELAQNIMVCDL